jgi:hypothetical protein
LLLRCELHLIGRIQPFLEGEGGFFHIGEVDKRVDRRWLSVGGKIIGNAMTHIKQVV